MEILTESINSHRLPLPPPREEEAKQSSAIEIGSNEDLSSEILLRLPPKSILKFKSVSKLWLSVVSSPRFLRLHTSRGGSNPSPTGLLFKFIRPESNSGEFDYVPLENHHHYALSFDYIIQGTSQTLLYRSSCNGLLLLKSYDYNDHTYGVKYYVTNPTTKKFKIIPIPPARNNYILEYLAFDPSRSPHYKVVTVYFVDNNINNEIRTKLQIDVYSLENEICSPPERNTLSFDLECLRTPPTAVMQEIFCNGILHMLGLSWEDMLCIDLNHQYLFKCPVPRRSGWVSYSIKQSGGIIYLIVGVRSSIDIHELKRDYSGWVLNCHLDITSIAIDCQRIQPNFPSPDQSIYMIPNCIFWSVFCEEDEEELTLVFAAFGELVAYNLTRKTTKIIGNNRGFRSFSQVFPHIETLARV